jgi:hypothetical protein
MPPVCFSRVALVPNGLQVTTSFTLSFTTNPTVISKPVNKITSPAFPLDGLVPRNGKRSVTTCAALLGAPKDHSSAATW